MAFYTQKITSNLKTEITATEDLSTFDSVIITNTQHPGGIGTYHKSNFKRINRQRATLDQLDKTYGSIFWLKTYLTIRMYESKIKWNDYEYDDVLEKTIDHYKTYSFNQAASYINNITVNETKLEMAKLAARQEGQYEQSIRIQSLQDKISRDFDKYDDPDIEDVISDYYTPEEEKQLLSNWQHTNYYQPENH